MHLIVRGKGPLPIGSVGPVLLADCFAPEIVSNLTAYSALCPELKYEGACVGLGTQLSENYSYRSVSGLDGG